MCTSQQVKVSYAPDLRNEIFREDCPCCAFSNRSALLCFFFSLSWQNHISSGTCDSYYKDILQRIASEVSHLSLTLFVLTEGPKT